MSAQGFFFSFGVFYKPLIDDFSCTVAEVALAPSIGSIIYLLFVLPASWMYKKINAKTVILLGSILMGLGLALSSQITNLWQLYFFYSVVAGIGKCAIWVPFTSTITKWFTKKRGIAMGIALSGSGFGALTIAPMLGYIIITYGWRIALLAAGLSVLLMVFSAGLVMKDRPEEMGLKPYGEDEQDADVLNTGRPPEIVNAIQNISAKEALRKKEFWLLYCLWIFSTIVRSIYNQHIVLFGIGLGILSVLAALALGFIGISSILGRLIVGLFLDRIGISRALILCYIINVVSTIFLMMTTNELSLFLFAIIFGFSYGGRTTLEVPMAAGFFGLANLGMIVGIFETAFGVGGFIGPYLAGYVFDMTGRYYWVFLFCILLSIISLAITISLSLAVKKNTIRD